MRARVYSYAALLLVLSSASSSGVANALREGGYRLESQAEVSCRSGRCGHAETPFESWVAITNSRNAPVPKADVLSLSPSTTVGAAPSVTQAPARSTVSATYAGLPLAFEPNVGQVAGDFSFITRASSHPLLIGLDGVTLPARAGSAASPLRLRFIGIAPGGVVGSKVLPRRVNYLIGPKSRWKTGVPTFAELTHANL